VSGATAVGLLQCSLGWNFYTLHNTRRLQSMMNAAARLVFASSKCDHHAAPTPITPHESSMADGQDYTSWPFWLCLHGLAPSYLADELHRPESEFRRRLYTFRFVSGTVSSPYPTLNLRRPSPVAAVRIWSSLPQHITSSASLPVFYSRFKTYCSQGDG